MSGVCACHGGLGRGRAGFAVPQSILGSIPGISVTAVVYAWRGLEMAGKWRHVARLRDPFVRGTVGGRFKKAESERGGGGGERRRKKRKSKKSQKKKKKKKGGALCKSSDCFLPGRGNAALGIKEGPSSAQNVSLAVLATLEEAAGPGRSLRGNLLSHKLYWG